jgi:ABC-type polysaccharide/polyol phosphate transport system ATPase subunit
LRRGEIKIEGLGKRYWFRSSAPKKEEEEEEDLDEGVDEEDEDDDRRRFYFGPRTELWALRDLFCHVEPGERIAVMGVNGSGKTTLIRILSRTLPPSEGTIEGAGTVIPFQALASPISGQQSGCDNLRMIARLLGLPLSQLEERLPEIAEFSELGALAYEKVLRYSRRSYTRLSLAMALCMDADIYLIDEGMSGPDPIFHKKVIEKFQEVLGRNRTLIFASNNLQELKRYCRRAIWLDRGRLVADGQFDTVIDKYLTHRDHQQSQPAIVTAPKHVEISADSVLSMDDHRKAVKRTK